ncbi:ketosynthase chain-length factor [Actinoplanes sp. NBRC 103695]|uniref:ketosynthase chain-length factor n=1 Tax=Actinoplanes sp. NBRC 103695 TaxID=3032202 RepID=UPI0024A1E866|nr:ketosynthase chain-length factor [Actinoplanes sp. NBRC 103695]GLZ00726.1 actinorhodin polyketide putative beta-ketoacyl synthase 2 [Actinoplanes sp. NBRC 103695]
MSTVVTGMAVAAPNGLGTEDFWTATLAGRTGLGRITRFVPDSYPARLAGEIKGFEPGQHLPGRMLTQTDHVTRLNLVLSDWAFADAGVKPDDHSDFDKGVVTASSAGGYEFGERELRNMWSKGGQYVSAYQSFAWFYAVNSGQLSIRHNLCGPSGVVVSDHAGGLDALAQARRQVRRGTPLMLSGAVDSSLCSWGWVAHLAGGRISTSTDPVRAYRPFDASAGGHVPGEGGAILVLEEERAARERGARIHGEFAGYGTSFDPRPGGGRPPALRRAVESALTDAGVAPAEVDVVFADAAAVADLDAVEASALRDVFGPGGVPVTAPKTMTGRLGSGTGALDVAAALLSIRDAVIPPTTNVTPDPAYGLDLVVGEPRRAPVRTALVVARGHGGFNSAVVVRAA